ncbi:hypothetical protein ACFZAV_43930 [Streptomyces sp. NPDC008343]|uniref:AMP-binding enzyme n=1 Tax=Streptomyces sp. NPDC008343 TaxID=3364828 RepID=UPI0036E8C495
MREPAHDNVRSIADFLERAHVVCDGQRVALAEVEAVLARHDAVWEAAVLPRRHALHGEILVAFVSLSTGALLVPGELHDFASAHLPSAAVPRSFMALTSLPRTALGRVDRRALRQRAMGACT